MQENPMAKGHIKIDLQLLKISEISLVASLPALIANSAA